MGDVTLWRDDDEGDFWARVDGGTWEPGVIRALGTLARPGAAFVDLGAWVGALSLYAAARGARVLALEPDPVAFADLVRNVAANPDLAGRITILPKAVARQAGQVRLGARRRPGDSMSSILFAGGAESWLADALTPEALLRLVGPRDGLILKLDIEGGEYDLLPALAPLLGPDDRLLASFHPSVLRAIGERDVLERARAALLGFENWRASCLDPEAAGDHQAQTLAPRLAAAETTWLLTPPRAPA